MADPFLRVHAVNIYVKDQARSLDFYLNTLGFHIAFDARVGSGERLLAVAPPDGSAVLTLIEAKPDSPQARLVGRATQVVFVTEDLPATYTSGGGGAFASETRHASDASSTIGRAMQPIHFGALDNRAGPIGVGRRLHALRGRRSELVRPGELRRSQPRGRSATSRRRREAGGRAARRPRARDRHAGAGAALSSATSADAHAGYAGACVQTRRVGGDYYDFLDLGRDRLGLVIGDIAGKGMPAALLMANLQANLRSQCATAVDQPERFLQTVNRLFYESTADNAYATFFYSEFDDRAGRLRYANCGHLPALVLRRAGDVERLEPTATVLGLFPSGSAGRRSSGSPLAIFWRSTPMGSPRPSTPRTTSSGKDGSSRRCTRIVTCRHEI